MIPFSEQQRFTQWWIWLLVAGIPVLTIASILLGVEESREELSTLAFIMILLAVVLPLVLFLLLRLDTSIGTDGIRYRFVPFHLREKFIPWSAVKKAYVRTYRPLAEYGGWGIKGGFGHGMAYNVKGNIGLQLELADGKLLLLGTQRGAEVEKLLKQLPVS